MQHKLDVCILCIHLDALKELRNVTGHDEKGKVMGDGRHLGMHFQLFQAPLQQLLLGCSHLDKVGGVEGQPLVIRSGQLASKSKLISNGWKVWQVLQIVEGAPGEDVACHPADKGMSIQMKPKDAVTCPIMHAGLLSGGFMGNVV